MKNSIAIIVLTWNDYNNTVECIKSIAPHLNKNTKLFLIDNNSNLKIYKKLLRWISKNYKKNYLNLNLKKNIKKNLVKINQNIFSFQNNKNLGCGLGHNIGYKFALNNNFKFIARIDNDMVIKDKFFFKKILKNFNNPRVQCVSPKIMYFNQPNNIWWRGTYIGNSLKFQTHMRDYKYGEIDNEKIRGVINTDAVAGCASVMRGFALKKSGLSDPDFFYGPEDVEFSQRIKNKTKGLLKVDLNLKIYHKVTQSCRSNSYRRIYFEYKYRLLLINKIGNIYDKLFGYSVSIIKYLVYCILFLSNKHKNKIEPVGKALIDYFILNRLGKFDRNQNNK